MTIEFWICLFILFFASVFIIFNKKIRCAILFKDLINIFYNNKTKKISFFDIISFFVCPTLIGISIVIGFNFYFSIEVSNTLLTIFSILFTILFGIMSLLTATFDSSEPIKNRISNETFTAVSFSMFGSLISLVLLIIYIVLLEKIDSVLCFKIFSGIIIALAINIIMLFFMIIKRSYVISRKKENN